MPHVDIFITCAGEDHGTVMNTIEAACAMDYPADRFRVIVLDDAGSDDLADSVSKLSRERPNCVYTARVKPKDHHFKAGNLNYGMDFAKSLPGGPADFIVALDADMIPDPQMLRALLPHILQDEKVAIVQSPQVCLIRDGRVPLQVMLTALSASMTCHQMTLYCRGSTSTLRSQSL